MESESTPEFLVILFYKYHPLSKDRDTTELYRLALENLCQNLQLQGRILVGCNEHQSEGINGTLSGSANNVNSFVTALTDFQQRQGNSSVSDDKNNSAIHGFWNSCQKFYEKAKCEPLIMTPDEFKWSSSNQGELFPDLNIKLVNELIGTGSVLASIPLNEVHQGYLTPAEWHERVLKLEREDDTLLIDCRNTKEFQIGNFPGSLDPNTTTVSCEGIPMDHFFSRLTKKYCSV